MTNPQVDAGREAPSTPTLETFGAVVEEVMYLRKVELLARIAVQDNSRLIELQHAELDGDDERTEILGSLRSDLNDLRRTLRAVRADTEGADG